MSDVARILYAYDTPMAKLIKFIKKHRTKLYVVFIAKIYFKIDKIMVTIARTD